MGAAGLEAEADQRRAGLVRLVWTAALELELELEVALGSEAELEQRQDAG